MTEPSNDQESKDRENRWRERRDAGKVNTISPHSGTIDWNTLPGAMENTLPNSHPVIEAFLARQDAQRKQAQNDFGAQGQGDSAA